MYNKLLNQKYKCFFIKEHPLRDWLYQNANYMVFLSVTDPGCDFYYDSNEYDKVVLGKMSNILWKSLEGANVEDDKLLDNISEKMQKYYLENADLLSNYFKETLFINNNINSNIINVQSR